MYCSVDTCNNELYFNLYYLQGSSDRIVVQNRIANGLTAFETQFPYLVSIRLPFNDRTSHCGGSIISSSWVLTACHCTVNRKQFILRFGSNNMLSGGMTQTSFWAVNHAEFDSKTLNNDLALIRIPSPLSLSSSIATIRLPTARQIDESFAGKHTMVPGWGETAPRSGAMTLLRWASTRVISNAQCITSFGSRAVVGHVLCTLGLASPSNQGACAGDSGGPLVLIENGVPTQIGIVAFAHKSGCNVGYPNGHMRTGDFLAWIHHHTGIPIRY